MFSSVTKALKKVFGDKSTRDIREIQPLLDETNKEYEKLEGFSADELRAVTPALKKEIADYVADLEAKIAALRKEAEGLPEDEVLQKDELYNQIDKLIAEVDQKLEEVLLKVLPRAFATIRETARRFKENNQLEVTATDADRNFSVKHPHVRVEGNKAIWSNSWSVAGNQLSWDMVHYDVQIIGGIALHKGKVAEMQTGEGKTLVATLPIYLNALAGKGVHLVTVNDYLAKRDSEWMAPLFQFHGLTVDCIDKHQPNSDDRKKAYQADITYGTNNEFGFDYLRDNMTASPDRIVQRKLHYAIVDEVDSVLIDDARTPLIISGPTPRGDQQEYDQFRPMGERLVQAQRQLVTNLLAEAKKKLGSGEEEKLSKDDATAGGLALFRAFRGLPKNKALIKYLSEPGIKQQLLKTEAYYLQDNQKEMPKADAELYFVIDEKNNQIELTEKGLDLISGDLQDNQFFVMPDMGTAIAEIEKKNLPAEEQALEKEQLMRDYAAKAERIHTVNQLLRAYTLYEKDVEYVVLDNKVKIVDEQTGRIMEGRRYSDGLHQAIESKEKVKVEAATQTYATITLQNYFRMYHKLAGMTGTAETEASELWDIYKLDVMIIPTNKPISRKDMEDKVYKTRREKYNAVIEEIVELQGQGRPVLVGTTAVDVSELLSRMLNARKIKHNVLNAKLHAREAEIVAEAGQPGAVTIATNMAGRGTDIKLGAGVKERGGLAIIGTEKHESRRVDRQLRGRSGRQGDPGSSQFYVSLEDDLMRLFGSDRIAKMMDRLGLKEGELIQHPMITRSIERAQKKVEENNFGVRKHLLEYDDVMNSQRTVIYKRRKHALFGDRLKLDIANMFQDVTEALVQAHHEVKDYTGYRDAMYQMLLTEPPVTEEEFGRIKVAELVARSQQAAIAHYRKKNDDLAARTLPVIRQVAENQPQYQNIAIPITDGLKGLQITVNIQEAISSNGRAVVDSIEKSVSLFIIDQEWKEHLRDMDDLRQSVRNAVYEQKDPLLIYKLESFNLFKKMVEKVNGEIVSFLAKSTLPVQRQAPNAPAQAIQAKAVTAPNGKTDPALSNVQVGRGDDRSSVSAGGPRYVSSSSQMDGARAGSQVAPAQPVRVEPKVGRNEPCPCGSGKKYKNCHGRAEA